MELDLIHRDEATPVQLATVTALPSILSRDGDGDGWREAMNTARNRSLRRLRRGTPFPARSAVNGTSQMILQQRRSTPLLPVPSCPARPKRSGSRSAARAPERPIVWKASHPMNSALWRRFLALLFASCLLAVACAPDSPDAGSDAHVPEMTDEAQPEPDAAEPEASAPEEDTAPESEPAVELDPPADLGVFDDYDPTDPDATLLPVDDEVLIDQLDNGFSYYPAFERFARRERHRLLGRQRRRAR